MIGQHLEITIATGNGLRLTRAHLASALQELRELPPEAAPVLGDLQIEGVIVTMERIDLILASASVLARSEARHGG